MEVVIHNIRSLFNIGACFRNCDAFGVKHLYLAGYTATPPRLEIAKTALGADDTIPWSHEPDILALIDRLQTEGKAVVAFESNPSFPSVEDVQVPSDAVILFGNEPEGLPEDVLNAADLRLYIPMQGTKTSLNISVACGVGLYALTHK
ncbi:RNA methyltransferase [Candidatus Uhrbacteria bacterium CG10_big_fil_rev_8_21_14_0_10_50_16]|uniref:RNA methyltransferase n=1 Tax=Candidatus Uhrbacteria bacterium CG10_big_fil_rev_8_21_14_0_10_50_16 TaxID=1975039 RepID=A0A2H0RN85_9BACT|nr:MAG: RNA methyltransferase [Candidatus Uhrbacteria bacterium CG10_big_fil_rev_8_21_14_0_10_50_16]